MYICAKHMKANGQLPSNTVVTTIMSNFGLYKAFDRIGIAYEKTAVGDRYVYENMKANDHMLGGEQSGHIIFRKFASYRRRSHHRDHAHGRAHRHAAPALGAGSGSEDVPAGAQKREGGRQGRHARGRDREGRRREVHRRARRRRARAAAQSGTEPVLRRYGRGRDDRASCEQMVDAIIAAMDTSGHLIEVKK